MCGFSKQMHPFLDALSCKTTNIISFYNTSVILEIKEKKKSDDFASVKVGVLPRGNTAEG